MAPEQVWLVKSGRPIRRQKTGSRVHHRKTTVLISAIQRTRHPDNRNVRRSHTRDASWLVLLFRLRATRGQSAAARGRLFWSSASVASESLCEPLSVRLLCLDLVTYSATNLLLLIFNSDTLSAPLDSLTRQRLADPELTNALTNIWK